MNNFEKYDLNIEIKKEKLKFLFNSTGHSSVTKVIEYTLLKNAGTGNIYNFGFGDYDAESDYVSDISISNNGDVYKVYNTVLSTVPLFFRTNPNDYIFVEGSDSSAAFHASCKTTCKKKCEERCRNQGRRISIYTNYINKNFNILKNDYSFWGGLLDPLTGKISFEGFKLGKVYTGFVIGKR